MSYSERFIVAMPYPYYDEIHKEIEQNIMKNLSSITVSFNSIEDLQNYINNETKEAFYAKRKLYMEKEKEQNEKFKAQALIDAGMDEYPENVKNLVFDKAWENSYVYGYDQVYTRLVDLKEFVDKIWKCLVIDSSNK